MVSRIGRANAARVPRECRAGDYTNAARMPRRFMMINGSKLRNAARMPRECRATWQAGDAAVGKSPEGAHPHATERRGDLRPEKRRVKDARK